MKDCHILLKPVPVKLEDINSNPFPSRLAQKPDILNDSSIVLRLPRIVLLEHTLGSMKCTLFEMFIV